MLLFLILRTWFLNLSKFQPVGKETYPINRRLAFIFLPIQNNSSIIQGNLCLENFTKKSSINPLSFYEKHCQLLNFIFNKESSWP